MIRYVDEGIPNRYGYNHVFNYIKPGHSTTRAQQIMNAFPDSFNSIDDVYNGILKTMKTGEDFAKTKVRKLFPSKNGQMRYLEIWLQENGAMGTAVPG